MPLRIVKESASGLAEYETVPMKFQSQSRMDLEALAQGRLIELPCDPVEKDYDQSLADRPTSLPGRFGLDTWGIWGAFIDSVRVGGILIAPHNGGYWPDAEDHRAATIVDLRVLPAHRGRGVGSALINVARSWAISTHHHRIWVETQDVNVVACGFYQAIGFHVRWIDRDAYRPDSDEAQVLWEMPITAY